jgi:hypothetical protein
VSAPILRTSERRAFKRCPQRWWWSYREGLKPVGAERTPLWFGTGVHLALAEWYLPGTKRGPHPAETFADFARDAMRTVKVTTTQDEETLVQWVDAQKLGVVLMEEYVKKWGTDPRWRFIQAEQSFSLDVPWPKPSEERQSLYEVDADTGLLVVYKGTYDGVYQDLDTGRFELLETKTAKAVQTSHLTMDDQAGSYWAVATATLRKMGLIGEKQSISGINYNFIRKAMPDERPQDAEGYFTNKPVKADYWAALCAEEPSFDETNSIAKWTIPMLEAKAKEWGLTVLGERSKVQPAPLFSREMVHRTSAERNTQLRRIQNEAIVMQAYRDRTLPLIKNPSRDCTWDCDFFTMCELQDRGGNWEDLKSVGFRREDPYKDHRKSTDE